jgi:hypothetical protein
MDAWLGWFTGWQRRELFMIPIDVSEIQRHEYIYVQEYNGYLILHASCACEVYTVP